VRELLLSDEGVTLTDVHTAGGEVLMGTLRWEKGEEMRVARAEKEANLKRKERELALAEAEAQARMQAIRREIESLRYEAEQPAGEDEAFKTRQSRVSEGIRRLRQGDLTTLDLDQERPDSEPPLADKGGEVK
jgi:circadian clock protein KaiC